MKKIKTVFCACFLVLINTSGVFASNPPANMPAPTTNGANVINDADDPEEPPGGPIDDNLLILMISGLVLGTVVVYKNKIEKASV